MKKLFLAMICILSLSVFTMSAANPSCQVGGKSVTSTGWEQTGDLTANFYVSNSSSEYVNVNVKFSVTYSYTAGSSKKEYTEHNVLASGGVRPTSSGTLSFRDNNPQNYSNKKILRLSITGISGDCR